MRGREAGAATPRWPLLALAGFVVALFAPALFTSAVLFQRDLSGYWLSDISALVRSVSQGELPLWNPWLSFGAPLLADPNQQLCYVPTWLNLLLPPDAYLKLYVVAHAAWGGGGALVLARRWRLGPQAAALAAMAWSGSGPWLSAASMWHHYAGAAWTPWVLIGMEDLRSAPSRRSACVLGALAGAQALAGSADLLVMTALLATVRVLPALRGAGTARRLAAGAGAVGIAALLGAVQWLPAAALLGFGGRGSMPASTRVYWSLHPASLLDLAVPSLVSALPLAPVARQALFEGREPLLASLYVGLPVLALGLVGVAVPGRRRLAGAVAAGAVAMVALALGRHLWPVPALLAIPPLSLLRFPTKYLIPGGLLIALAGAAGLQTWQGSWPRASQRRGLAVAAVVAGLGAILLAGGAGAFRAPLRELMVGGEAGRVGLSRALGALLRAGGVAVASAVLLALRARRERPGTGLSGALLALCAADLLYAGVGVNRLAPAELLQRRPELAGKLADSASASRYYVDTASFDRLNRRIVRGPADWPDEAVWSLGLQDLLMPPSGGRWALRSSFDGDFTGTAPPPVGVLSDLVARHRQDGVALRLLRAANVGHVISLEPAPLGGALVPIAEVRSVYDAPIRLSSVPDPMPRAYAVGGARVVAEPDSYVALADPAFDPRVAVLLAPDPVPDATGTAPAGFTGRVAISQAGTNRLVLDAQLSHPGWVVAVEAFHPGWRARVDGNAAPLLRANLLFRAVPVPAGSHRVEMDYRSPGLVAGALLSLAGLALLAAGLATSRRRA